MAKIVGYRPQEGVSKTGNDYKAMIVHFVEEFRGTNKGVGYETGTLFLMRSEFDAAVAGRSEKDILNADFEYARNEKGNVKYFALLSATQQQAKG